MTIRRLIWMFFKIACVLCHHDHANPKGFDALNEDIEQLRDPDSGCLCRVDAIGQCATCVDSIKCTRYPSNYALDVPTLILYTTNIQVLRENDMKLHANMTCFSMEMNNNLTRIEPGAFKHMSNLVNLTISSNRNLRYLDNRTFEGLVNLKALHLEQNGFQDVKDFSYSIFYNVLPSLQQLTISSMPFKTIQASDFLFKNMLLEEFYFTTCSIKHITPEPFVELQRLRLIDLSENIIQGTSLLGFFVALISKQIPLEEIRLDSMGFNELPYALLRAIATSNVHTLSLSRNQFETIPRLPYMPHIVRLTIADSVILNLDPHAFRYLPRLKHIILSGNKFGDIPDALLLPHIECIDVSYAGRYFRLETTSFSNMTSLRHLDLSGNNLRRLSANSFAGLWQLEVLLLRDCNLFFINGSAFRTLQNLRQLDLGGNMFPSRDIQPDVFSTLCKLEGLRLGSSMFKNVAQYSHIFRNLTSLKSLSLQDNQIEALQSTTFSALTNLIYLNLSSNDIMAWDEEIFTNNANLKYLNLNNNKIKEVTVAMLRDFNQMERIYFHGNPLMCKCPDINALYDEYALGHYLNAFGIIDDLNVSCSYPKKWSNRKVIEYLDNIGYDDDCRDHLTYIAPLVTVTIVLAIAGTLTYLYRWHIRYWLFLTKLYLARSGRVAHVAAAAARASKSDYVYDAFVSYSNEDREFVTQLVNVLERHEPFYRLCVYERDFQIGTSISETVLESVARSRKTLLIVSAAYIKSTWCRWEVQVAENRRLFWENEYGECVNDSLVIVKFGDFTTRQLNPMLRYLMKTRVYLEWESEARKERVFWCKLRNSLGTGKGFY